MKKNILKYIFVVTCIISIGVFFTYKRERIEIEEMEKSPKGIEVVKENQVSEITIDVKGAVQAPGVYTLKSGSRVRDAILQSGGLREDADTNYLNLSKTLKDEMVLIIYTKAEIQSFVSGNVSIRYIDKECICPNIKNDGCITDNKITNKQDKQEEASSININTASKKELLTLPGIGESKAELIVQYREKTPFTKIEDIKKIKGIGDSIFDKIKEYITV